MFVINFNYDYKDNRLYKYKKTLINIANCVYKKLNLKNEIYFDCSYVNKNQIQEINFKYRKINKPTDVISFALWDNKQNISSLLGEIYICVPIIYSQANEYNHSFRRELCFLFLHGLLHLLGYDHQNVIDEKNMFGIQDEILDNLNIKR